MKKEKDRIYWYLVSGLIAAGFLQWFGWIAPMFIQQSVNQKYFVKEHGGDAWFRVDMDKMQCEWVRGPAEYFAVDKKGNIVRLIKRYEIVVDK